MNTQDHCFVDYSSGIPRCMTRGILLCTGVAERWGCIPKTKLKQPATTDNEEFGDKLINDDYSCTNSKLRNIVATTRLSQIVETPTRVTINSTTLLDVIITNAPNTAIASEVTPCPIADHDLIFATINIYKPKHQLLVVTKRQLRNYSPALLCNTLCRETSSQRPIFHTDIFYVQVNILTNTFRSCLDLCATMVSISYEGPMLHG